MIYTIEFRIKSLQHPTYGASLRIASRHCRDAPIGKSSSSSNV